MLFVNRADAGRRLAERLAGLGFQTTRLARLAGAAQGRSREHG
jgi:predicted phosphoribosyltransferase